MDRMTPRTAIAPLAIMPASEFVKLQIRSNTGAFSYEIAPNFIQTEIPVKRKFSFVEIWRLAFTCFGVKVKRY